MKALSKHVVPGIGAGGLLRAGCLGLCLIVSGCATNRPISDVGAFRQPEAPRRQPEALRRQPLGRGFQAPGIERSLRVAFRGWEGTRYRYGGEDRNGVDCSGFVKQVFDQVFQIPLPRTAISQSRVGFGIRRDGLLPGDMVFFRTRKTSHHVGIYLGAGEFIHASSSQGVTLSRLDSGYWRGRYWAARRVLRGQ